MDKSMDSIGSCSLDVDADNTDFSDTSGSLNFPTPVSVKDIVREFTSNIQERCLYKQNKVLSTNDINFNKKGMSEVNGEGLHLASSSVKPFSKSDICSQTDKKPSYLNLACCVNGYSNITTYDSKVRQDINKSREVSPIRGSTSSILHCKNQNCLAPPVLHTMPNVENIKKSYEKINNGNGNAVNGTEEPSTSFIKQRVERLYGPGALAQGFYSPRRTHNPNRLEVKMKNVEECELVRKFNELSPCKDYIQFNKKINNSKSVETNDVKNLLVDDINILELPVLRHLSEEFRAQLPAISPKKCYGRASANDEKPRELYEKTDKVEETDEKLEAIVDLTDGDEIDKVGFIVNKEDNVSSIKINVTNERELIQDKKGTYFLGLLKAEQERLISLAENAEKYTNILTNNDDISDDTLGLLRSASGKARLLVSQKMKQFEGLCHNNLKCSTSDQFPTTNDDLQGFWDMVYLQISQIDSIFQEIEELKANDWKMKGTSISIRQPSRTPKSVKKQSIAKSNGSVATPTSKSQAAALRREMQRKQILEMKKKKRLEMTSNPNTSDTNLSLLASESLQLFVPSNDPN